MPCACGRPFVPDRDMYVGHVQTSEHLRWRRRVIDGRRPPTHRESMRELFGMAIPRRAA